MSVLFLKFLDFGINDELAIRGLFIPLIVLLVIGFCFIKIGKEKNTDKSSSYKII